MDIFKLSKAKDIVFMQGGEGEALYVDGKFVCDCNEGDIMAVSLLAHLGVEYSWRDAYGPWFNSFGNWPDNLADVVTKEDGERQKRKEELAYSIAKMQKELDTLNKMTGP